MKSKVFQPFFLAVLILSFAGNLKAQKNAPYEMVVDGVKVIVQPSGNEIVQIQAVFKGGVQNYPSTTEGIENLAMTALTECGTENDDKNNFKNKLDKVSGQIYGNAGMDFSSFNLNCIREDLDVVWPLYVDALTRPKFDEKEFDRIKQDAINNIKEMESRPDYAIRKMARTTAFAGLNYSKDPMGSVVSVGKLSATQTKDFYKSIAVKSRMIFVIVADIERAVIEQRMRALLSAIPAGKPFVFKKESFLAKANTFASEKKELATNYLHAIASGPAPGTKDFNAFLLAMEIFYDRHFLEVRTNNGLSYAPFTYFDGGLTPSANIGVSTTDPDKYILVFNKLVDKTRKGFTDEEVRNMKTTYITGQYYRQETNAAQATSLASNEVLHNNWRRSYTLNEDLKSVTAKDVTAAFNKYLTKVSWVYQGDPAKVHAALYTGAMVQQKLPSSSLSKKKPD
jgi:predicted Zn-dependent peptidase